MLSSVLPRYGARTKAFQSPASSSTRLDSREWQELFSQSVNQIFSLVSEVLCNLVWQTPVHPSKPPPSESLSQAGFTGKIDLEAGPPVSQTGPTRLMKTPCTFNIMTSSFGLSLGSSKVQGFTGCISS